MLRPATREIPRVIPIAEEAIARFLHLLGVHIDGKLIPGGTVISGGTIFSFQKFWRVVLLLGAILLSYLDH